MQIKHKIKLSDLESSSALDGRRESSENQGWPTALAGGAKRESFSSDGHSMPSAWPPAP